MKKISVDDTIYKIVNEHPDIKDVLSSLGLTQVNDDKMLNTVARVMTIRKVARLHDLEYDTILNVFHDYGYDLIEEEF